MIETRLISSFICVAEELHFGKAAERLHIAQPALSRQIQQLESGLGVTLFERTQRRVALSAAGRIFLERAYAILADIKQAVKETRRASMGEAGLLSIGLIHSSTYSVAPRILGEFHARYPNVELELYEMTIWDQFRALLDNKMDIAILRPPVADPRLDSLIFRDEHFLVAVAEGHRLSALGSVRLAELAEERFVMFSQRHSPLFHARIFAMCEAAGVIPQVAQYATQIHTLIGLVNARLGIAIVPDVARNLHMPGVLFLTIEDDPAPVHVALAWRRQDASPTVKAFRQVTMSLFLNEAEAVQ